MNRVVEDLRAARALIEDPANWAQGNAVRTDGRMPTCAGVAIDVVAGPRAPQAQGALMAAIDTSVIKWNDAPERTHAEVLAAFDRAIEEASREEG